jgi:uncharacterized membrane protein
MSKFIVVIFPDESKVSDAVRALRELHMEGALTLYGSAVIAKDKDGKPHVKHKADQGPMATAVGTLTGSLVGLLGGPAGVALGMSSGALLGSLGDLYNLGVGQDFIDTVARDLTPGKTAVVAEIQEDFVTPLDARMAALGGTVIRQSRATFEDNVATSDALARKADLARLKAEYAEAKSEDKAKLKAHIDGLQAKAKAASTRIKGQMDLFDQEADAKIKALQDQAAKAKADAKTKIDQRITEVRADRDRRTKMLQQAWDLTKEAIAS